MSKPLGASLKLIWAGLSSGELGEHSTQGCSREASPVWLLPRGAFAFPAIWKAARGQRRTGNSLSLCLGLGC